MAKRLADVLGVDETQVIQLAIREWAKKYPPQYEADAGALTKLSSIKFKNQHSFIAAKDLQAICNEQKEKIQKQCF